MTRSDYFAAANPPPKKRRWPWVVGAIVAVLILTGVLVFTWASRKFHAAIELQQQAAQEYKALQKAYPFQTPALAQPRATADPAPRVRAALDVREKTHNRVSAEDRALVQKIVELNSLDQSQKLYLDLLGRVEEIQAAVKGNQADLRAAQMSPKEYSWLMGGLVYQALRASQRGETTNPARPAGDRYWDLLRRGEQLAKAQGKGFSAQRYYAELEARYGGAPVHEFALANLNVSDTALGVFDLIAAGGMLAEPAQLSLPVPGRPTS